MQLHKKRNTVKMLFALYIVQLLSNVVHVQIWNRPDNVPSNMLHGKVNFLRNSLPQPQLLTQM